MQIGRARFHAVADDELTMQSASFSQTEPEDSHLHCVILNPVRAGERKHSARRPFASAAAYMNSSVYSLLALCASLMAAPLAQSHEFWIEPVPALRTSDASARLVLRVGEYFEGEQIGLSSAQTSALRHYGPSAERDLRSLMPATPVGEIAIALRGAGTHLIAYDSQPSRIDLAADKFHAYLHDEGLDAIKAQRESAGTAAEPGRERYRRNVKTLIAVGRPAASDTAWATRTGQRLEIVPLANPLSLKPGGTLPVQLCFDGKPLAGALVKAWHRRSGQTLVIRAKSAADGKAAFELPYAGSWMLSVVHMVPADSGEAAGANTTAGANAGAGVGAGASADRIDWDSLWGNLSFVMPGR
jgi:uncharacterized GH25 family protein